MGESGVAGPRSLVPVNKLHERNVIQYFVFNFNIDLSELRQILCKTYTCNAIRRERCMSFPYKLNELLPMVAIQMEVERFGRLFSIRKTYFLQVKRLILVGTLE